MSGWDFEPNVFEVRHGRTNWFEILVLKIFWSTCLMAMTTINYKLYTLWLELYIALFRLPTVFDISSTSAQANAYLPKCLQ